LVFLEYLVFFEKKMKLTKRQETFIKNLLDLYLEVQEAVHYPILAERLGVSSFTAYDMLRVLEEKGYVESIYKVSENKSGRSERLFIPTKLADKFIDIHAEAGEDYDWEAIKSSILEKVESGEFAEFEIGQELIARVPPEGEEKIQFCIEVMTILALRLHKKESLHTLREYALEIIPRGDIPHRAFLLLFGGFALGVLAQEPFDEVDWLQELIIHIVKYQEIVSEFNDKECRRLYEELLDHFSKVLVMVANHPKGEVQQ